MEILALIVGIIGVLLTIWYGKRKKSKEKTPAEPSPPDYYKFIWKDAKDLTPEDVLGLRGKDKYGYREYYYERDFHRELVERIRDGKDAIVVGMSLSGKTRTVYQVLKSLGAGYSVTLMEKFDPMEKPDLTVPPLPKGCDVNKRVLVIDDINYNLGNRNFTPLLNRFMAEDVTVAATCRTGPELAGYAGTELSTLFGKPVEIPRLEDDEAETVLKEADIQPPDRFDGNIGSLFIDLGAMKKRYNELNREEKRVLKAINRLHYGGVFIEKGVFPLDRVKRYYEEKKRVKIDEGDFKILLEDLSEKEFLEFERNRVRIEEAYLEELIEGGKPTPEDFAEMIQIFINDPDALFYLGVRAGEIGLYDIRMRDYMKVSILANLGALKFWTVDSERYKYASTQNNLGSAYLGLSAIKGTTENQKRAIEAYNEALKVYKYEEFPTDYAMTQNNLGISYIELAKIEDTNRNLKNSIKAFKKALKVRTLEEFPIDYATTQNNLGNAYGDLAKIEDTYENLKNSIKTFNEALRVRTLEEFPIDYAQTQNNLGVSYKDLSAIEERAKNLKRAIGAHNEASKVRSKKEFPIGYGMTKFNLGNVYIELGLAEATDNEKYYDMARDFFNEALEIFKEAGITQYIKAAEENIEILNAICKEEGIKLGGD